MFEGGHDKKPGAAARRAPPSIRKPYIEACRRLAKNSFDALAPGGRILLCEVPIDDTRDGPLFAACFTVAMLIRERGRQYSIREFRDMLTGAGFMNFASQQIFGYYHLISAQKPQ